MGRKRGRMSTADETFVMDNVDSMTIDEIALALNRDPEGMKDYIAKKHLRDDITHEAEYNEWRSTLHNKPYWKEVKKQLADNDDVIYFEETWIRMMMDFAGDVKYSEELQMKQLITLEISMNDCQKRKRRHILEIHRNQAALDDEYDQPVENRNFDAITKLQQQQTQNKGSMGVYDTNYLKMLHEHQGITKQLKADRERRKNITEDAKTNWSANLKLLDDPKFQEELGLQLQLRRLAKEKSKKQLSELHTFMDGTLDRPLFNHETVE